MAIHVRELTDEECGEIEYLASSRTAPAQQVERAQIIRQARQGLTVPTIAEHLRLNAQTVRDWLRHFNAEGLAGLDDRPRSGKPPIYTPEQKGAVVAAALSDPQELGQTPATDLLRLTLLTAPYTSHLLLYGAPPVPVGQNIYKKRSL